MCTSSTCSRLHMIPLGATVWSAANISPAATRDTLWSQGRLTRSIRDGDMSRHISARARRARGPVSGKGGRGAAQVGRAGHGAAPTAAATGCAASPSPSATTRPSQRPPPRSRPREQISTPNEHGRLCSGRAGRSETARITLLPSSPTLNTFTPAGPLWARRHPLIIAQVSVHTRQGH